MDYNQTLNLPKTDFPMRAALPQREPEFLKAWEENDQYRQLMQHNEGKPCLCSTTDLRTPTVIFTSATP